MNLLRNKFQVLSKFDTKNLATMHIPQGESNQARAVNSKS